MGAAEQPHHQRGETIMRPGVLPFQYAQEKSSNGMTALAGLPLYLALIYGAILPQAIQRHGHVRDGGQGYTDAQVMVPSGCYRD
jgi:hypothetical protein